MGFGSVLNLSSLNGSNGFAINGINPGDLSGYSVNNAGDFNGDGRDDIIIGAPTADPNGNSSGQSYLVFGSTIPFAKSFNLSSLNGSNGFAINGINDEDRLGSSVSYAGDINGDGRDDLLIAAKFARVGYYDIGQSYVVFGSTKPFASSLNLSSLNGSKGFIINPQSNVNYVNSVSNAGDINGDGRDDLIIGAAFGYGNKGQSYVVFGSTKPFASSFNLSSLNGSNGFAINGVDYADLSGWSVSSAGDINGDGTDDIIIGAIGAIFRQGQGQSYVVFGSTKPFASSFNLSSLNGSNGFAINGINAHDYSGWSVSSAGDINGDGTDDIIIGAKWADNDGKSNSGQSYIVFGSTTPFTSDLNLSSLNGSNGFAINGINSYDNLGSSVSYAGDINGDGRDDIIIGAYGSSLTGQSYVVFGSNKPFPSSLNLSSLNSNNGFIIKGVNALDDRLGGSVSNAGDINGDGRDDIIIGAASASPNGKNASGQSYVVFGQDSVIKGDNNNNLLNGTSNDDIILGFGGNDTLNGLAGKDSLDGGIGNDFAYGNDGNDSLNGELGNDYLDGSAGNDYVNGDDLSGTQSGNDTVYGSLGNDTVYGGQGKDYLDGGAGNDLVDGWNGYGTGFDGNDTVLGGDGNDSVYGGASSDFLDGGTGNDSLLGGEGIDKLYGNLGNDTLTGGIGEWKDTVDGGDGNDYLLGGDGNDYLVGAQGNDTADGGKGKDLVFGDTGNDFLTGANGNDSLNGGAGNDTLNGYGAGTDKDTLTGGTNPDLFV